MKRFFTIISVVLIATTLTRTVVSAQTTTSVKTKKLEASQILLQNRNSSIQAKGVAAVLIKDKLKITGDVDVSGNIKMKAGKKVDGVDVSALDGRVVSAETAITALQQRLALPTGCTSGQVAKYNGTTWACADDIDTNTGGSGTTYTAGSGIAIEGTTIRSTVVDTNTTYTAGSGIQIDGTTISSALSVAPDSGLQLTDNALALKDCSNGEFIQQYAGSWICQDYDPIDQYDNTLVVAKSGARFSTITAAMDSITDASTYNRYVILVQPGVYEEHVEMKDNVSIQGVDKESVFIADPATTATRGTINAGTNTSISNVTIYAQAAAGGSPATIGVYADETSSTTLDNVKIQMIDPIGNTYGIYTKSSMTIYNSSIYAGDSPVSAVGIYTEAYLTMRHSEVVSSGSPNGVGIQFSDVSESNIVANISNSSITAYGRNSGDTCMAFTQTGVSGTTTNIFGTRISATNCATLALGVSNVNGTIKIDSSRLESSMDAITAPSGTVRVGATMLQGPLTGSDLRCVASYDETYTALSGTCS